MAQANIDVHSDEGEMSSDEISDLDPAALKILRANSKRALTRVCKTISNHVRDRGSRSALATRRSYLAKQLDSVSRIHQQYVATLNIPPGVHDQSCEYMREVEDRVKQANQLIDQYLQSRKDEPPSTVLSSVTSSKRQERKTRMLEIELAKRNLSKEADEALQLARLEDERAQAEAEAEAARRKLELTRRMVDNQREQREAEQRLALLRIEEEVDDQSHSAQSSDSEPGDLHVDVSDNGQNQPNPLTTPELAAPTRVTLPIMNPTHDLRTRDISTRNVPPRHQTNLANVQYARSPRRRTEPADWIDRKISLATPIDRSVNAAWFMNIIPKVEIKPFGGDPKDWPDFISSFKDMIHDVIPSNAQKLGILRQLLTADLRSTLAEYLHSPDLYFVALAELKKRYGQPQVVARAHLRSLMSLQTVRDDDHNGMAQLSRTLRGAMRSLEAGGYEQDLESGLALEHVVNKLPSRLRHRWGVKVYKMLPQRATLRDLANWIDTYCMADLMTGGIPESFGRGTQPRARERSKRFTNKSIEEVPKAVFATSDTTPLASISVDTQVRDSLSQKHCFACDRTGHSVFECTVFRNLNASDRAKIAKDKEQCFRCLNGRHKSRSCWSKVVCSVEGCEGRHHYLIHGAQRAFPPKVTELPKVHSPTTHASKQPNVLTTSTDLNSRTTLLKIVPVKLRNNETNRSVTGLGFLDSGSDITLLDEGTARELELQGPAKTVKFGTFHGNDPSFISREVSFVIEAVDGSFITTVSKAATVPKLNVRPRRVKVEELQRRWTHLAEITPATNSTDNIIVLIGADLMLAHLELDIRLPPPGIDVPCALRTPFGWSYFGSAPSMVSNYSSSCNLISAPIAREDDPLHDSVKQFLDIESFGTRPDLKPPISEADQRALEIIQTTTTFENGHYSTGLPWIAENVMLPNNFVAAAKRMYSLERRFRRDPEFARRYASVVEEYVSLDFARRLTADELNVEGPRTWYLIHHGVINPHKPDRIRVVFDASAKFNGTSLNDVLLKGPNLLIDLHLVLIRFRQRAVPICADVKKMFHQVRVNVEDQPALRFLWKRPGDSGPPQVYQMQVHVFGAISSPFVCSHIMRRVAEDNRATFPDVADLLSTNFYVDNLLDSYHTEEEAIHASHRISDLLSCGGFHLNQWMSTSRRLLTTFPSEDRVAALSLDLDRLPVERTLGVLWDSNDDVFKFQVCSEENSRTKRQVLRVISSVFDPLGFLAPAILMAKTILQSLWSTKLDWDEEIESSILGRWNRWLANVKSLEQIRVPRSITRSPDILDVQLHVFCDASEIGFGAVSYSRVEYVNGSIDISFIFAKTRVAPVRPLTIPRLELNGAVLALRISKDVLKALQLPVRRTIYWTDSQTVLQWINSSTCRFHVYVANRIAEILDGSRPEQWRHVPGKLNPADYGSRGVPPEELTSDHWWFSGPTFLKSSESSWPCRVRLGEPSTDDPEVATSRLIGAVEVVENRIEIFLSKQSRFLRVRRCLAFLLRFVHNSRSKLRNTPSKTGQLRVAELQLAVDVCIRLAQRDAFPDDFDDLSRRRPIQRGSPLITFTPFMDLQSIIRVGGRIDRGDFPTETKHPIILPSRHHVTRLIIWEAHCQLRHPSTERLLAHLRGNYWILRGRATIKRYT